ncbi:hypothetical protein ACIQZB_06695 [Streptomyces sp. NPDC097727]
MKPLEFDRLYGELDQAMRACAGQPADDGTDRPGDALLASMHHTRP